MSSFEAEKTVALIRLDWQVSAARVKQIRSGPVFACNAGFPDQPSVDSFSVVLRWPTSDPTEAQLSLLVQNPNMRPVGARIRPGERISVTEGPSRVIAEAEVIRRLE